MSNPLRSRDGFAMPMTILVLVLLAVGITGSLSFITSERRVIENISLQERAFLIAQDGLDQYLSNRRGLGFSGTPGATESIDIDIDEGTAEVVLERIRPASGSSDALYVVRSTGVIEGPRPQDPDARRTVAQLATWEEATLGVSAGWLSLTGLEKEGTAGTISGEDNCGVESDVPGVAVPVPPGMTIDGTFEPEGDPPIEDMGTIEDAVDAVPFDWEGIVDLSAISADVVLPGDSWPSFSDPDYWPIVYAPGDFVLPSSGRGILIVTGSLTIGGTPQWEGIVLVGDHLVSNGNNKVLGATYTGLNAMLADDPEEWLATLGQNTIGNGTKIFVYDSCNVEDALQSLGGLRVIDNAWMDNWPAS